MRIAQLLQNKRVIITLGAGGVGKTSLAAAIGMYYAILGKRVMVVTIDPARRLASALGVELRGGAAHLVDLHSVHRSPRGFMYASMLDSAAVFREFIQRTVKDPNLRQQILSHRFFEKFTEAMSGTQEQAAVERLFELVESGKFDLIVLDTPPSQHALEFLTAPRRLLKLLDDRLLRWIAQPASAGLSMFSFGSKYIAKMLAYFAGSKLLTDVAEIVSLMAAQWADFKRRAEHIESLLQAPETAYLLIATPERHAAEGAISMFKALTLARFNVSAAVFNRVETTPHFAITADSLGRQLRKFTGVKPLPEGFAHRVFSAYMLKVNVARLHRLMVEEAQAALGNTPLFVVPSLRREISDLQGVFELARALFTASAELPTAGSNYQ